VTGRHGHPLPSWRFSDFSIFRSDRIGFRWRGLAKQLNRSKQRNGGRSAYEPVFHTWRRLARVGVAWRGLDWPCYGEL